eukprot:jgi/Hompol1/1581/HPOL_005246-RA
MNVIKSALIKASSLPSTYSHPFGGDMIKSPHLKTTSQYSGSNMYKTSAQSTSGEQNELNDDDSKDIQPAASDLDAEFHDKLQ